MSINEELSFTEYTLTEDTTDFIISFDRIGGSTDEVSILVNNTPIEDLVGYTVLQVNFSTWQVDPALPAGTVVRLARTTNLDKMVYVFTAGSKFIAKNVDDNFKQIQHSQQEIRDRQDKLEGDATALLLEINDVKVIAEQAAVDATEALEKVDEILNTGVVPAGLILTNSGQNQQQVNDFGGAKWYEKIGGYDLGAEVRLENGDRVLSTVADNMSNPNVDMTGWVNPKDTLIHIVDTVAELASMGGKNGDVVYVKGFRAPTNLALANPYKGGGDFIFIESLSTQNDGISVFNGWVRLNIKEVTPEMAGAYADFVTDDEDAFVKAQELARKLRVPLRLSGLYAKSKPFVCIPWDVVLGTGHRTTRIRKISNATSGLAARQAPEKPAGTFDDYDVDALLIFYPWDNTYADHITVRDVYFEQGEWGVDASRGYGFYAPRHAICNTENLQFENVLTAFYAKVFWNNTHKRIGSVSGVNPDGSKSGNTAMVVYDGAGQYTGTSNICEHFLLNNFKRGYEIQNLQTSTFTACYGEAISDANGANDTQIFFFVNPHDITLNGCGQESSYGTPLYISAQDGVPNCSITLNGFQAVWGTNGTTTEKYINMLTIDGPVTVTSNGSNFRKGNEGFIFDGFYLGAGSTLINNGSSFGASSVQHSGSRYIDVSTAITEKDGFSQATKTVGNDLNNGCEDKAGLTVKSVKGATLNIPTGFTDVYGISEYFGLNETQGIQFFMQVPQGTVYKRTRTAANTFTTWVAV